MNVQLAFNASMKQIGVLLKKKSFKKQGNLFYKQQDGNWGLISFQKSVKSTSSEIFFTINLGICSHAIMKFLEPENANRKPNIADCHWQMRLGDFIGNGQDIWWTCTEATNSELLTQEIENLLIKYALPCIDQLISDEQLASLWHSKLPDRLDFRQKLNLAILFKKLGNIAELGLILKQLENDTDGKPTQYFFNAVKKDLLSTD